LWIVGIPEIGSPCHSEALRALNIQHPECLRSHTPPTPAANSSTLPIGHLWLLSPRHVGCRHALRRSSCATPAQGEVSLSPIGHGIVADSFGVALHAGQPSLAAQNFNMPALSPTMTEGNIANWKIKEGTTDPVRHTQAIMRQCWRHVQLGSRQGRYWTILEETKT
jgi:hypothetical protein